MTDAQPNLQIDISLVGVRPPVWRRLVIASESTLAQLHTAIQAAMGWQDRHLHVFRIGDVRYTPPDEEEPEIDDVDESSVTIAEAFAGRVRGVYEYDFGDSWEHELVVEKSDDPFNGFATCLDGERACPPEDSGGSDGYSSILEVLANPAHEEYVQCLEWVGSDFNPESFDLQTVNRRLESLG